MTISDPVTFTKPWDVVLTYRRQPDEALAENVWLERKQPANRLHRSRCN